jgi:peptide/nickel transport system ATP-binding protein/oligopeptide transport system ATP-binding protein
MAAENKPLLQVNNLRVYFQSGEKQLRAVDGVSFSLNRGKTLGIVGESGCGKSIACMSILRLVQSPPAKYVGGEILFDGRDTLKLNDKQLRELRGARIGMIFQEPMTALNPVYTVGQQLCEAIRLHLPLKGSEAKELAMDLLRRVRVPDAGRVYGSYPFTLSGGLRQRVMIASALACKPDLLIADEPTTALDVTIQSGIMALLRHLRSETGMAVLLVSHDLSLVYESADHILVMYAGRVCEYASADELVENPLHPYTMGLINSRPSSVHERGAHEQGAHEQGAHEQGAHEQGAHEQGAHEQGAHERSAHRRLSAIPGNVPSLEDMPTGCPFHTRCGYAGKHCGTEIPPETVYPSGHRVVCWRSCI